MEGQLYPDERQMLYNKIKLHKPRTVLEIGTWQGGGSTLSIHKGLLENGTGALYTCEIDKTMHTIAKNNYVNKPQIELYNCNGLELFDVFLKSGILPDFLFFDGSEDPEENLNDFIQMDKLLRPGTVFMAHDWDVGTRCDGLVSSKSALLRPHLEANQAWEIKEVITAPISVGMVYAVKK